MGTVLVGQTTAGTTADFFLSGDTAGFPFTAAASGTLATLFGAFKVANAGLSTAKLGIYSDDAVNGRPGNLLASGTASAGFTGTGQFSTDVSASAVSVVSGTKYWLAFYATGEQVDLQGTTSATGKEAIGNMPSPFGAPAGGMGVLPVIWGEDAGGGGGTTVKQLAALGAG